MKIQPSAENGYLCVKAENQYATVFHFTNPFSPLLSRWLVKEKKKSMPTSNHMCNKWCWLCSCGVTTDGVVIVLPQSACAHFRHTLHTAPMGTFSTEPCHYLLPRQLSKRPVNQTGNDFHGHLILLVFTQPDVNQ